MKAPSFWFQRSVPFWARPLAWLGHLYGAVVQRQIAQTPGVNVGVPVICVGNLTVGGVGKTPIVQDLARRLLAHKKMVGILSRGYGGRLKGPLRVNTTYHKAQEVGDEPLLLAKTVPTWVAKNRVAGAQLMKRKGIDVILMDDGHQNPHVHKHLSLVVVDGAQGFGNGCVFPGGPLRESVDKGLARAHAVIQVGPASPAVTQVLKDTGLPCFQADFKTDVTGLLKDTSYIAFAGIGHPPKFFKSLSAQGINLQATHAFADHHVYTDKEINRLKKQATDKGCYLLTTEKDYMRLSKTQKKDILWAPLTITWKGNRPPATFVLKAIAHAKTD